MLRAVYGTAGTGKADRLFDEIGRHMEKGELSYILVPEQFSLYAEKKMLRTFGMQGQRYVKVLTFSRLCNMVMQKFGPLRLQYIDGAGKQIVTQRTLGMLKKKLRVLGRNTAQKGFAEIMVNMISECKRYGVLPEDLMYAAEKTENKEFSAKLLDIADIYQAYNSAVESRSADADDNLSIVAKRMETTDVLKGHLYLWHFRSFTPTEYQVLGSMMRSMDVTAVLCTDTLKNKESIFEPIVSTWEELCRRAAEAGAPSGETLELKGEVKFRENPELLHLKNQYFEASPETYEKKPENIEIITPINYYREAEAAADLVLRLCRTKKYRMRDILILARGTERYNRIMPSIFKSRGLSVFLDAKRPIGSKPLVRMVQGILECLSYGYSYERVMKIARTDFTPAAREEIDLLENYILEVAPSHAMWEDEVWTYNPDKKLYDMEKVNSAREKVTSGVRFMKSRIAGVKSAEDICAAIMEYLRCEDFAGRIRSACERFSDEGQPYLAEETRQVWNALLSVLAQMGSILKEEKITYRQFSETFASACAGVDVGLAPQTLDAVCLSDIDRFRFAEAKVVIVLSVTAGVFPKGYTAEGILSDKEREELFDMGIRLAPSMAVKRAEEQILLYNVLTAPSDKLYIFSPLGDNDGKALQVSEVVSRLRTQLFPKISVKDPDEGDPTGGAQSREAVFEVLVSKMADCGGGEKLPDGFRPVYTWFSGDPVFKKRLADAEEAIRKGGETPLSKEMVKKLYGAPIALSASRLEKYNSCAFNYFMTYGLFAEERRRSGIEPRSTGSVQHAALYNYFTAVSKEGRIPEDISKEECYRELSELVEKEVLKDSAMLYKNSAYYKYVVMRMRQITARTAWEVVKFYKNSSFRPFGFELKIGVNGDLPIISLKRSDGTEIAKISGMIDRADTAEVDGVTYINLVDYKSSAKKLSVRMAEDGISIQPLLYTKALCDYIKGGKPGAMLYMQMTEPMTDGDKLKNEADFEREMHKGVSMDGWIVEDAALSAAYMKESGRGKEDFAPQGKDSSIAAEEMERRIEAANQKISETAEEIISGNIAPVPYITDEHNACTYCPYDAVCRADGTEIPCKKM